MPTVSREFNTKEEAEKWIKEMKVTDNVTSARVVATKWQAIVDVK